MTSPNTPAAAAEQRPEATPSRNGSNLSDRVRSLRLSDKSQSGGGSRGSVIPWTLCALLVLVTAAFGYRAYMVAPVVTESSPAADAPKSPSAPGSGTASSSASSGDLALEVKGFVAPIHQIQVSPKISGQLVWLHDKFEEGAIFQKGDVLAKIEAVEYQSDYDHAKANLAAAEQRCKEQETGNRPQEIAQAKADLEEQKANLEQLRLDLKRNVQLASTSAAAARDYELAKYSFDAMDRRVARLQSAYELMVEGARSERKLAAKADVEQAKADLAKAEWRLKNTEIVAPVTGTILKKQAELGNLVNPSAFSNGLSASLCDMADLTQLEIEVKVLERDRTSVFVGQKCWIMPEAFQRDDAFRKDHPRGYEGVISRILPAADRSANAILVRVKVLFSDEEVRLYKKEGKWSYFSPDMSATVSFLKKSAK
jgi:HlyD family secretion protein